ncbi:MAG TPA: MFS transporter [Phycisphaerae bacterium]|nr:MFS transporter [Phycisphaerae bacterium]HRY69328.1 MFS transporter [Phycisphaerae bacterium]HSA26646.1 MFS transporter [Phycisphaerae bacterium]
MNRLLEFFGLRRSIVGLLGVVVLVGLGEKMAEQFRPIYLIALGGGILAVSIQGFLDNLINALYSLFGGYVTHRVGTKRALLIFNLMAIAGFAIVIAIPTWQAMLAGSVLFLSWTAVSLPATMSLLGDVLPKNKQTMGVSVHSLVRRLPMAVGPIVGGILIDRYGEQPGMRLAFAVAMVMALVALWFQQRMIVDAPAERGPSEGTGPGGHPLACLRHMSPELRSLLVSDILIRFCEQIPNAFVVVWCMTTIASPLNGKEFGLLKAVEMMTAVLVYVPVAYLADRGEKKPFVLATFVFFTLFPAVLLFCHSFWPLVGAFVLRGLKEFGEPTRKALILALAPSDTRAAMFGAYYLVRDSIVSLSALAGGFVWWFWGSQVNLWAAFGCGVVGTVWFAVRGRDVMSVRA